MAYISTSHSVGDIVYAYDEDSDSVQRLRVIGLRALTEDATKYGSGQWRVHYVTVPAQAADDRTKREYLENSLHARPEGAFPDLLPEAAPDTVAEAA